MVQKRYSRKDLAGALSTWWALIEDAEKATSENRIQLDVGKGKEFIKENFDPKKSNVDEDFLRAALQSIKLRYVWAKHCFDGRLGYQTTDETIKDLEEIRTLASSLAEKTANFEALHIVGSDVLNLEVLKQHVDSQGVKHEDARTFFGFLMSRVCIDSTVLSEGLSEVRLRS